MEQARALPATRNGWRDQVRVRDHDISGLTAVSSLNQPPLETLAAPVLYSNLEMQIKPIVTQQADWLEIAVDRCICQDRAGMYHWSQASSICGHLAQSSFLVLVTSLGRLQRLMQEGDKGCINE